MDKDGNKISDGVDWPKPEAKPIPDTNDAPFAVYDYMDEFVAALMKQLRADHERWGATWRNRTKAGQELRTKERFDDYFDQFLHAGVPLPWLKIVGGAMIGWIREMHPEVCPDISIAEECEIIMDRELKEE